MNLYKHPSNFLSGIGNALQSPFLLLIRLFWGWEFCSSGFGKLVNIQTIIQYFTSLDIPFPMASAYLTAGFECVCGALLILGLVSRLAALPLICIMVIAFLTTETDALTMIFSSPLEITRREPFTFLLAALLVFLFGPGKFSLDYLLKSKASNKT